MKKGEKKGKIGKTSTIHQYGNKAAGILQEKFKKNIYTKNKAKRNLTYEELYKWQNLNTNLL